jgi:hypothetical protein
MVDFYVATDGNDKWSGTLAALGRAKTIGPFATLERARDAVRESRAHEPGKAVTVHLRGGRYEIAGPLVLGPEDSGSGAAPVVWTAYRDERPVVSGGVRIANWKRAGGAKWKARIPEVVRGEWYFSQIFVNGKRRYRPRLPKAGYSFVAGELPPTAEHKGKGHDRFRFKAGDIKADWRNRDDVEVVNIHIWSVSRMRIADVDERERVVTFTGRTRTMSHWGAFKTRNRYICENVADALTDPGEWYLDRKSGELIYIRPTGENMRRAEVIAPRAKRLLEIKGDVDARKWVEHVTFRGIAFEHTNWECAPGGNSFPQAEAHMGAAIELTGARDCALERCSVSRVGEYAISLGKGVKRVAVRDCELWDMGAGGVKIGEQRRSGDEEEVTSHCTVTDCLIAHGGRMHPAAVGVWMGHTPHNVIEHNDIHDFYYTGISPGWSWGYAKSHCHHNSIAWNHIHTLGQAVLSDMGGIYTLGVSPGTVLHHNHIHDVESFSYGGWGIYSDEGTTGMLAENNVVYRTKSAGFHQHYGRDNVVRNNVFAFGGEAQLMRTRHEEHLSFTVERNIVYWRDAPLLGSNWKGGRDRYRLDRNLYWEAGGADIRFAGKTFDEWKATGQDAGSLIADPRFRDPEKGDFTLGPGSPASRIGFEPIDISTAGRRTKFRNPSAAEEFPRAFPGRPPPQPVGTDFEDEPVGGKCPGAITSEETSEETGRATARVTEETAASGKRSLKFQDSAGQKHPWNPHIHFNPGFRKGTVHGSFALRLGEGAVFFHEWRTPGHPYKAGPSIRIADGKLTARGKELMEIPMGEWVRFEITCGLGAKATGRYDLGVKLPGRERFRRFHDLPCDAAMKSLGWWGFVSDAREASVFYLDDLALVPGK